MKKLMLLLFMAIAVPAVFAMVTVTSSEVADTSQQVVMLSQGQSQIQIAEMATPLLQEEVLAARVEEVIAGMNGQEYAMGTMDAGTMRCLIADAEEIVLTSLAHEVTVLGQFATARMSAADGVILSVHPTV